MGGVVGGRVGLGFRSGMGVVRGRVEWGERYVTVVRERGCRVLMEGSSMLQAEDLGLSGSSCAQSVRALFEVERFVVAFCHHRSCAFVCILCMCLYAVYARDTNVGAYAVKCIHKHTMSTESL